MTEPMPPLGEAALNERDAHDVEASRRARELGVYLDLLSDALRARGARTRVVREVVGEVRGHCQATGTAPLDAFGPAEAYASRRYRPLTLRWVLASLASAICAAVGIVALATSATGTTSPDGGVVVTWSEVAFAAAIAAGSFFLPWLTYAVDRVLVARRLAAGRTRVGWVRAGVTTLLILLLLTLGVVVLPIGPETTTLAILPRWVLVVGGLVLLAGTFAPTPGQRPVPGPVVPGRPPGSPRRRLVDWLLGRAP